MVGRRDLLACADLPDLSCASDADVITRERANFEASCLAAYVVPGAGHSINTQRNAVEAYKHGNDWLDAHTVTSNRPANLSECA